MIYIEFVHGLTHTALLKALWTICEKNKLQSPDFFLDKITKNIESFNIAGKLNTSHLQKPDELRGLCNGITPLCQKEIAELKGDNVPALSRIYELSNDTGIDFYDIVVYLLLLIFMETLNFKSKLVFFRPIIGTASSEHIFSLFSGKNIIIDPGAAPVTPMCAAFLHYYADSFVDCSKGIFLSYDAINDPLDPRICVRIFECDSREKSDYSDDFEHDIIGILEANIDDCTPEVISGAMARLLESGALDYTITPVMMKKGRSGFQVQVLCKRNDMNRIAAEIVSQTSTFGVRMNTLLRIKLQRKIVRFQTTYGMIHVKLGYRGTSLVKATPEFDDLQEISRNHHVSLYHLYNNILSQIEKGLTVLQKMIQ